MRRLFASTCLTTIGALLAPGQANAETVIDTRRTTPVATSTIKNGAADDIKIVAAGSVEPTSGVAVTIDSNNSVRNEGTIQITNANDATGILANAGVAGTITNTNKIVIDESFTPTDSDNDGDLDGPLASGTGRYGIRTAGAFTGNIVSSGTITIEGKNSAGIALGGPLTGALTSGGTIAVTGDNSYGIRAGDISGKVTLTGTISATGANAVGVALDGNIGGALVVQGAIGATGYRNVTPPSDTSKLDADDLLQGGPALRIAGNVAGGILFDAPPANNNPDDADEDDDGTPDADEGSASVVSAGSAPAVQIGAADHDVAVGAVAGNAAGHGLVVKGSIRGTGVYKDVAANGLVIGGMGGAVTIAGGMTMSGSISATSNGAGATAIRVGDRATVDEIRSSGTISAAGGAAGTGRATALLIEAGAQVSTIRNSGQITAATTSGTQGTAAAIVDRAGTVDLVENSGTIAATGADAGSGRNIAIDLSANPSGATVRQLAPPTGAAAPSISGDVLFGGGTNLFDIADGTVTGNSRFGDGTNRLTLSGDAAYAGNAAFGTGADTLTLGGTSTFTGNADFKGGVDTLTLSGTSRFTGTLSGSSGLALTVTGGTLDLANTGTVSLSSLSLGATGAMSVNINAAAGTNTLYQVSGDASFAAGSKVIVRLSNVRESEGSYVIVRAGALTGGGNLSTADTVLPFLYKSTLATNTAANEINLTIARKTATELGLNRSQASAYNAIYQALDNDAKVAGVFLDVTDGDQFRKTLRQMLPDHAGGTFEAVTQGSRATARMLADPNALYADQGSWGFWLQQVAWGTSKSLGDTASYDVSGWGTAGGLELEAGGIGNFGVSLAYLYGKDSDGGTDNEVDANQYEGALYWRGGWGRLQAHARVSAALIDFGGMRKFSGTIGTEDVSRVAKGDWKGRLYSAAGGISYEMRLGRLSLRPVAAVDYYKLKEKGYSETGGGDAFNLIVDGRSSDEIAVSGTIAAGLNFGGKSADDGWFRAEVEGGRRQLVGGSLGSTTARFKNGTPFTLEPEERTNGWVGALRLLGGNAGFVVGGEFHAEEQQGHTALAARVSVRVGL